MSEIKSYRDLKVWQKGIEIVKLIYIITKNFPEDEKCVLVTQLKRAAVSIPSNIAEGWGRNSKKSFAQFLRIARGYLYELETQSFIAYDLEFIEKDKYNQMVDLINEESKMLIAFAKN